MTISLYVEGGGDSRELRTRCREGFSKLLAKAGFTGQMPRIVACGSRGNAYDSFKTATSNTEAVAILLVDSEDPVREGGWDHLRRRDGWARPSGARDDQVHLMVTCMETWLMADRAALRSIFRECLQESALLPLTQLEERAREEVQAALEQGTRDCGRSRSYAKGKRSFQILAEVDPERLRNLPHFERFIATLARYLSPQGA